MMRNKNVWILLALAVLIALAAILAALGLGNGALPDAAAPSLSPAAGGETASSASTEAQKPWAYLVVTVAGTAYQPIALTGEEAVYPITQPSGEENVLHVTKEGVYMESATCGNQDCVHQGMVTLENMDSRVLGNMIICLPNQVTAELVVSDDYGRYAAPAQEP